MGAEPKQINYGLKFQARSLVPTRPGDSKSSRWLVGTNALRDANEVQVLEFEADREQLRVAETHAHPPEIWQLAPHLHDASLLATVYNEEGVRRASLWRMRPGGNAPLEQAAELRGCDSATRAVHWHPSQEDSMLSVQDGGLQHWNVRGGSAEAVGASAPGSAAGSLSAGAWDPHDAHRFATTGGTALQVWDVRTLREGGRVGSAHLAAARDVSFAPRQQHLAVTCGDDAKLRLWDLRALGGGRALAELGGHSHWVWQARFNPVHDCLLLSASSDALVNLWFLPALGAPPVAAPAAVAGDAKGGASKLHAPTKDGKVKSFMDHEDSVYSVAWSASDPWTFASLSYDGRVAINTVSSQVKYKILI